jgi:GT2 family glycosyltransferase
MDYSFIIVNYNSRNFLCKCLQSIYNHLENLSFDVIVVDNASTDDSVQMIENDFPKVRLIKNKNNFGYAAAINMGLKESVADYYIVLNNDIELMANIFAHMRTILENDNKIALLGCRYLNPDGTSQKSYFKFPSLLRRIATLLSLGKIIKISRFPTGGKMNKKLIEVDYVKGALMMIKREAIEKSGSFDENYFLYHEEMDLCYKFNKDGWKICSDLSSEVIHHGDHIEDPKHEIAFVERNKNLLYFYNKYYSRISLITLIIINLIFFSIKWFFWKLIFKDQTIANLYKNVINVNLIYFKCTK